MKKMELVRKSGSFDRRALRVASTAIALACSLNSAALAQACEPSLTLTHVPPAGCGPERRETISGQVSCADNAGDKLIIYSLCDGNYWVQPFKNSPDTYLNNHGTFNTAIHLGEEYHILLTTKSYIPASTLQILPPEGGGVLKVFDPIPPAQ